MTNDTAKELDAWRRAQMHRMESLARSIRDDALNLSGKLAFIVKEIAANGTGASLNSLGEIQGSGQDIDRQIIKLATMRAMVADYDAAADKEATR